MTETITLSAQAARRFLVRAFALDGFQTLPDVPAALERLEFVQEDSINVCGRMHDLILWPRVRDYTPRDLHETLYEAPRRAFEYYFPNLCVLPVGDYCHFLSAMRRRAESAGRWHGLSDDEQAVAEKVLALCDAGGPLRTRHAGEEDGHTRSGWGTRTRVLTHVTEKLWLHGRLSVARRENFERWFDRTERLLPEVAELTPTDALTERTYLARKRLRAKRLFRPRAVDRDALGPDAFVTVRVEGDPRPWFALAEDADALRQAEGAPVPDALHLLGPLDPLVYDRTRTRTVFGFDYTWEVYTPAAKRRWGYYVLPILHGDRLIGRADPKVDRKAKTLTLHSLTLEPGVDADAVAAPLADRLRGFARWLGAERVAVTHASPPELLAAQGDCR